LSLYSFSYSQNAESAITRLSTFSSLIWFNSYIVLHVFLWKLSMWLADISCTVKPAFSQLGSGSVCHNWVCLYKQYRP